MARGQRGARTTALKKYALLESTGIYYDGPGAEPQEVVVRFGEATLTLQDFEDMPVAHWTLAGLRRLKGSGPGELRVTPDMESDERLVIHEPEMIEAIEAVCDELDQPAPSRRRRGRGLVWTVAALAILAVVAAALVPDPLGRAAALVPPEQERRVGEQVRSEALRLMAAGICRNAEGRAALDRLSARLLAHVESPAPLQVDVARSAAVEAFAAPGGQVVLTSGLVEAARSPEEVAAALAHQLGHVARRDPLDRTIRASGFGGVVRLILGMFGEEEAAAASEALLTEAYSLEAEEAADGFAHRLLTEAGLPASALAAFFETVRNGRAESDGPIRHLAGQPALAARAAAARAADQVAGTPFRPALDDAEWIALQQICE